MLKRKKIKRVLAEQEVLVLFNAYYRQPRITLLLYLFTILFKRRTIYISLPNIAVVENFFALCRVLRGNAYQSHRLGKNCKFNLRFYVAEVVCALEFLHLMGFIYRDLKPESTKYLTLRYSSTSYWPYNAGRF